MTGIIVVTGIMAAGKSTVAQAVAERLDRSVHLRGDVFRRMIVRGEAPIGNPLTEEALRQLRLRYRLACSTADGYAAAGFTVVLQDIVLGPDLAEYVDRLRTRPRHLVVLAPSPAEVARRESGRAKTGYGGGWTPQNLDDALRTQTPRIGLWLDTTGLTVDRTADTVLARLDEARLD